MNGKEWSADEKEFLCLTFPDLPTVEIAAALRRSISTVYGQAYKLGLHKSAAYHASPEACRLRRGDKIGAAFRFLPGHVPANKGTRRPGYAPGRMRETQFRKGGRSANYLPIGTQRVDSDGYLREKIADGLGGFGNRNVWAFVHRQVWEAAHGPIPEGHRIWWKDGDRMNCALDNLEILSGAEHMARTTIHNLPPALKGAITAAAALKKAIRRKSRAHAEKTGRSA